MSARLGVHRDPYGRVHWIEVPRQRGFEPLRHEGRVWIRRGRATVEPSPTELQELYNLFGYILTEERCIEGASVRDIDSESFRAFLARQGLDVEEAPQPDLEEDLRNRGVLEDLGGALKATLYGLLCFGREPQAFPQTRGAWIECVAYGGRDRSTEVLLTGEAKGRIDEQVRRALGWMRAMGRFERYRGLVREDIPLAPVKAVREALVNAVAHRDYAILGSKILLEVFSDRISVTSPGTLPNRMTPASALAGGHPRSRNELMANYLLVMGLMERRGRGLPIVRRAMREFNGTEPELLNKTEGPYVRLTLFLPMDGAKGSPEAGA